MPTIKNKNMVFGVAGDTSLEVDRVFQLPRVATASLPSASQYEGGLVYDTTDSIVKYSNGTDWVKLPEAV